MQRKLFKQIFDKQLDEHLSDQGKQTSPFVFSDELGDIYTFLHQYSQGGKRIRPYLVYLVYKLCHGGDDQLAIQTGIVNELIHLFALIHDDIADGGLTRHHLPTYHTYIQHLVQDAKQGSDIAILMGDLVLARAYKQMNNLPLSASTTNLFHEMMHEVICGQIMDVYLSHYDTLVTPEIITQKDKAKSGRYTFQKPMLIGAHLAGNTDNQLIAQLGDLLGVTYQMRDDLFDIIDAHGDKTSYSDHQEGNQTFLLRYAYDHATPEQQTYLTTTRGQPTDTEVQNKLHEIYTSTGTIDRAKTQINTQIEQCHTLLDTRATQLSDEQKIYIEHFRELVTFLSLH